MYIFLTTFFTLYGLLHLHLFFKAKRFFGVTGYWLFLLTIVLVILCFMPLFTRLLERRELFHLARVTAYIGYLWMAGIFLFFVLSLILDLFSLVISPFYVNVSNFSFVSAVIMTILLLFYGFYEANNVGVERVIIKTAKLPKDIRKIKIVQISDLHLGLIIRERRLNKVLSIIKGLNPDIVVATGDIVDGQTNDILQHSELFSGLKVPFGKYAITGNHEYYAGIDQSVAFIEKSGFTVLRGSYVTVGNIINLVGVDDMSNINEVELLSKVKRELFTVFLKHRPLVNADSAKYFDIQLSGHTHRGQIFPFYYITKLVFPHNDGLYEVRDGHIKKLKGQEVEAKFPLLYTSRGTGTWGPPIRILAPPEVTLIELVNIK